MVDGRTLIRDQDEVPNTKKQFGLNTKSNPYPDQFVAQYEGQFVPSWDNSTSELLFLLGQPYFQATFGLHEERFVN